ncbi:MAG: hypothetical protein QME76_01160 [Bacillota bacterium]|nr:hypothetical protein [Bacillota bacterium]
MLNSTITESELHTAGGSDVPEPAGEHRQGLAVVRNHRIVWHDRGLSKLLGYGPYELVGCQTRVLYADDISYITCSETLYGPNRSGKEIAVSLVSADGKTVPCRIYAHALEGTGSGGLWLILMRRLSSGSIGYGPPERDCVALESVARAMAGDLRNPLSVIRGYAQFLVEELKGTAARRAEQVLRAADELAARMGAFLSFFSACEAPRSVFDLNTLVADLVPELEILASSYLVRVNGEFDRLPCFVRAEPGVLRYALLELAWPVLEAMKNRPLRQLYIKCAYLQKRREVEVVIEASGASPASGRSMAGTESARRLKAEDTERAGLAVAQAVIVSYGGRVILHSNQEGGLIRAVVHTPEAQRSG